MDLLPVAVSFQAAVTVFVSIATLFFLYTLLRPKFKCRVQCWFCSQYLWVNYANLNSFYCTSCEQYNGFTANGDYNKRMREQTKSRSTSTQFCSRVQHGFSKGNGLCQKCNENQVVIVGLKNRFEPKNEAMFSKELREYEESLNRIYPLCGECKAFTSRKLERDRKSYGIKEAASSVIGSLRTSTIWKAPNTSEPSISNESRDSPSAMHEKRKARKQFFNNGRTANYCFVSTFILALLFLSAQFDELQVDSGVLLLDLHVVYPSVVLQLLPFVASKAVWLAGLGFTVHCLGIYSMETRVIFPDLLSTGVWSFMVICHWTPSDRPDLHLVRFITAAVLCITTCSVAFLPRKKKHRKRPNTIFSAFSVASTPISQCTTLDSSSLLSDPISPPSLTVTKKRSPNSIIANGRQVENRFRERGVTPSRELGFQLGGLSLGFEEEEADDMEPLMKRVPFSSINYNPSVLSTGQGNGRFNADRVCVLSGKVSIPTSSRQKMIRRSTALIGLICFLRVMSLPSDELMKSINAFSEQLERRFHSQSRIEQVHRDVQKQLEGWIVVHSNDFFDLTEGYRRNVQKYFHNRTQAIRRIVSTAESESRSLLYSAHETVDDEKCQHFMQQISRESLTNHSKNLNDKPPISGVHVNVETYVCDGSVVRDSEWTGSPKILKTMQNNRQSGLALSRQYIGTYSGLTRVFPSFHWTVEPSAISFDLFDPRYRQWFIGAESAPKDVLFLIDFSGSVKGQTQHLTKMTILHVLATLSPNDYFNAVWYSSRQELVFKNCFTGFLPATTRNKRLFQNQLEKIEERDQAHLAPALNYSMTLLRQGEINASEFLRDTMGVGSGGHQIIMIFTDGIEEWPVDLVKQEMNNKGEGMVRIFGFSMGYGTGELPILDYVSCNTGGTYAIVDSIADVKHQSRSYVTTLSEVLALAYRDQNSVQKSTQTMLRSPPYMDTQENGPVITLSMPILNEMLNGTNGFLGVAGVDIPFTELAKLLPNDEQIHAFIIDNNGVVMYHPKLMTPTREVYSVRRTACYDTRTPPRKGGRIQFGGSDERVLKLMGLVDSIQTTDIMEIEKPTETFKRFRRMMIDRMCGDVIHDGDVRYRCAVIENTPLVVGFVEARSSTVLSLKYTSKRPLLVPKELVGYYVPKRKLCGDLFDAVPDLDRLDAYVGNERLCREERKIPYAFTNILSSWSLSWPEIEENLTCSTAGLPDDTFTEHHISSFVFTRAHISAFYPKCNFALVKPVLTELSGMGTRDGSKISRVSEGLQTYVIDDTFVASKDIQDLKHDKLLATVGVQWKTQFVQDLWYNLTHEDNGWAECFRKQVECYIVTTGAYVVASSTSKTGDMAQLDSNLFKELRSRDLLKAESHVDHQKYCKPDDANSYSMSTSLGDSLRSPLRRLLKVILSTLHSFVWFVIGICVHSTSAQPVMVGSLCKFSRIKHLEQCSIEYTHYTLRLPKSVKVTVRHENCSRSATIIPFSNVDLNLVIAEGLCDENETFKGDDPFKPRRIPDCQLTAPFYRKKRPDFEYRRFHPDESLRDCPTASAPQAPYSPVLIFFLLSGVFYYG